MKKLLVLLVMLLTMVGSVALANHEASDPYDAMCQATGPFEDVKLPCDKFKESGSCCTLLLRGQCGEAPNLLAIDRIASKNVINEILPVGAETKHSVVVWSSPRRADGPYWLPVFARDYYVDAKGEVVREKDRKADLPVWALTVRLKNIHSFTLRYYEKDAEGNWKATGTVRCTGSAGMNDIPERALEQLQRQGN